VLGLGGALGAWFVLSRHFEPAKPVFAKPASAAKEKPWENSLGMKFVPLPKRPLLVSVYETRLRDYIAFSEAENAVLPDWRVGLANPRKQMRGFKTGREDMDERNEKLSTWDSPGFAQTPDHPVTGLDLVETRLFCAWLTWKERQEGRLTTQQAYRLPREAEWNEIASHDTTIWQREDANAQANFAGIEVIELDNWPADTPRFERRDPFPRTAPVGSFPANALGLYDLFGNVAEWVDTPAPDSVGDGNVVLYGLRGGSWATGQSRQARPDFHIGARPGRAQPNYGFRIVLDLAMKPAATKK
jgi:formylglycine-generating enzyme required for sulfatase activity